MLKKRKNAKIIERNSADFLKIWDSSFKPSLSPNTGLLPLEDEQVGEVSEIRFLGRF